MYEIGDKVQAYDGRIGIATDAEVIGNHANLLNYRKDSGLGVLTSVTYKADHQNYG